MIKRNIIDGYGGITREINMHMAAYEENAKINCVIHAHALNSMVFASMGLDMPNISEGTQKWEKSNVWNLLQQPLLS